MKSGDAGHALVEHLVAFALYHLVCAVSGVLPGVCPYARACAPMITARHPSRASNSYTKSYAFASRRAIRTVEATQAARSPPGRLRFVVSLGCGKTTSRCAVASHRRAPSSPSFGPGAEETNVGTRADMRKPMSIQKRHVQAWTRQVTEAALRTPHNEGISSRSQRLLQRSLRSNSTVSTAAQPWSTMRFTLDFDKQP